MFRIRRFPLSLDKFFLPLHGHFHWDHCPSFRLLVVTFAFMWERRNVANLYRYVDAPHHRTRFNNCFLVDRWDPAAALRQKARERLCALHPQPGDPVYWLIDDAKKAKRGKMMDAVAKMQDPVLDAYIRGHHDVCAIMGSRGHVIPFGIRLYVKQEQCRSLERPFQKTTALVAQLIRECQGPRGLQVMVLFDPSYLGHTVVKACREQRFPLASTLQSHRRLLKAGWQLKACRYGKTVLRRRRTTPLLLTIPQGSARYRSVDAGWLTVSNLGLLHVVFSRRGGARKILELVTDGPDLSTAALIQAYARRWDIEPWITDVKPLLGFGHSQHRSDRAAVTHRPLVGFASALLTHRRIERKGAQGQRTHDKAADLSTAAAQDQLRGLVWNALVAYLKEQSSGESGLAELERLRVACNE